MKKLSIVVSIALILSAISSYGNGGPQASFTWSPPNPSTADIVQFNDTSDDQANITERMWNFGDGSGSTEKNPTHQYKKPGTYTVTLIVIWNISGSTVVDIAKDNITIENQPPIADAGPDQIVNSKTVSFDGRGSSDPDGEITSYEWDFGDGSTASGATVQHTYASDGIYTVTLNVTDDFGAYDEDTCQVIVDTSPPQTTVKLNGTAGENDWYISNVTVKFVVNETGSGVNATFYKIDNGNWTKYTGSFVISEEGEHLLQFYSDDIAGNVEETKNVTVKIDKTAPSISIETPQQRKFYLFGRSIMPTFRKTIIIGRITVVANASDNLNLKIVKFYVDGDEKYNDTQSPYEWKWGKSIGSKNLTVKAFDDAGLHEADYVEVFIFSLFEARGVQEEKTASSNT